MFDGIEFKSIVIPRGSNITIEGIPFENLKQAAKYFRIEYTKFTRLIKNNKPITQK